MADGKWVSGLNESMYTEAAGRLILESRLERVCHYLPLAVESAHQDVEHVHQLRVATRRASVALNLFAPCLPGKIARTGKSLLRKLRRAAGEARDWDVFQIMLDSTRILQAEEARPLHDLLSGYAGARRIDAQNLLARTSAQHGGRFDKACSEMLNQLSQPDETLGINHFGGLAEAQLTQFIGTLNEAIGKVPESYEELHQVRILGKRLRYAIELFADCFHPKLREQIYPTIEEAQEILGHVTDSHVAGQRLMMLRNYLQSYRSAEWPRFRKGMDALVQAQRRRFPKERKNYLEWLPRWQGLLEECPLESLPLREFVQA